MKRTYWLITGILLMLVLTYAGQHWLGGSFAAIAFTGWEATKGESQ